MLLQAAHAAPEVLDALGERSIVAAMLRYEAALARAQAACGLIPSSAAQSIIGTCKVELFDVGQILREGGRAGGIAAQLISSLRETVGLFNPEAAAYVHHGCSLRDVNTTARALITREVLNLIRADLTQTVHRLLQLAEQHAATPMSARHMLPEAGHTSFGYLCAAWAAPLVLGQQRLDTAAGHALTVNWTGGPSESADMTARRPQVLAVMAGELALDVPSLSLLAMQDAWTMLACEFGVLLAALGRMAADLAFLSSSEVGEITGPQASVQEGEVPLVQMARQAWDASQGMPWRVAGLLAGLGREYGRPMDLWQPESPDGLQLLLSLHGCAHALARLLIRVQARPERMRAHGDGQALSPGMAERSRALIAQLKQVADA